MHVVMLSQYHRNVEAGIGPERMWDCHFCGQVPA